jgi:hypothetical protein
MRLCRGNLKYDVKLNERLKREVKKSGSLSKKDCPCSLKRLPMFALKMGSLLDKEG